MFWNDLLTVWWMLPLGIVIGIIGTLIGAGGGFILMPIMLMLYPKQDHASLTAISLAMIFANAVSGSISYARMKRIDYRAGVAFALAGMPGAVAGRYLILAINRAVFNRLFGGLMLAGSLFLMYKALRPPKNQLEHHDPSKLKYSLKLGVVISFGVGVLSSLLGIGGGIIHVPFMIYALDFPVHLATATSHFILAILSGTGTAVDLWQGVLQPGLPQAVCVSLGVVPGAMIGARISKRIHGRWIVGLLAMALVAAAARILLKG